MFFATQVLIIVFLVFSLFFLKKIKFDKKLKSFISIILFIFGIVSNIILSYIPLPASEVTLTALGEKNPSATEHYEVKILNLEVTGETYEEFELNEGKWMREGTSYYMWRIEEDSRQPDGMTRQIKFDIPFGLDRNIVFKAEKWSGLVEVYDGTNTQIVDLYSENSTTKKVSIEPNSVEEMYKVKFIRLLIWISILATFMFISTFLYQVFVQKPKYRDAIILSIILLVQTLVMVHFGFQKNGFHVDEIWMYQVANQTYEMGHSYSLSHNAGYFNTWHSSDIFHDVITVSEEQRFNYKDIYKILENDNHPPLYFLIIHTISSIFYGTFSEWFAIVPNIVFLLIATILLFKVSNIVLKNRILSYSAVILWGFSQCAISSIVFFRMYILVTMMVLLFTYVYLKLCSEEDMNLKSWIFMMIATFLGCMSQYYFMFYAFFFTLYVCAYRFFSKKYKEMLLFGTSVLSGVILMFINFPAAINGLFFKDRGKQAVGNIERPLSNISSNFKTFFNSIFDEMLTSSIGSVSVYILIAVTIFFIINKFLCRITLDKQEDKLNLSFDYFPNSKVTIYFDTFAKPISIILFSTFAYIYMVSWIGASTRTRYIWCIFPLFAILFIFSVKFIIDKFNMNDKVRSLSVLFVVSVLVLYNSCDMEPDYLYNDHDLMQYYAEENAGLNAIVVPGENIHWGHISRYNEYINYDSVLVCRQSNIENLGKLLDEKGSSDTIMLYLPTYSQYINDFDDVNEYLNKVKEELGYKTSEKLHSVTCPLEKYYSTTLYRLSNPVQNS